MTSSAPPAPASEIRVHCARICPTGSRPREQCVPSQTWRGLCRRTHALHSSAVTGGWQLLLAVRLLVETNPAVG